MELLILQSAFRTSAAIHLLRSNNAPYILDFLHTRFKAGRRLIIPDEDLRVALADYQETVRESDPMALPDGASSYLTKWCERGFLHRFFQRGESGGEAVFQLTSHTEAVLRFLETLVSDEVGFVGTESRVRLVMDSLRDLIVQASGDPGERLRHLREEQSRIEAEIERVESSGAVEKLGEVEVRERFGVIIDLLKQVQGDFRHVEERFKDITRELQRRQLGENAPQGELIGFALDAEDLLMEEDQGQSFEAFSRLILSHRSQEELHLRIDGVLDLAEVASQRNGLRVLENMPAQLLAESQKVMETTQRLSGSLRLLLDDRATSDQRRIRQLLAEIREQATMLAEAPPSDATIGIDFDPGPPAFRSPMSREFFRLPEMIESPEIHDGEADTEARDAAFRRYAAMARLDWDGMRQRIEEATANGHQITLGRLLELHPPRAGAVEVVGYIRLAHDERHLVDSESNQSVILPNGRRLDIPRVVYLPKVN